MRNAKRGLPAPLKQYRQTPESLEKYMFVPLVMHHSIQYNSLGEAIKKANLDNCMHS